MVNIQPEFGPEGAEYAHRSVRITDAGAGAGGFWLYEPADPSPDSANVVIFLHGYGSYNPFSVGKWIKHLVGQGNIVIYPRYQQNNLFPRPPAFPEKAAEGILTALDSLRRPGHVQPCRVDKVTYIGYSYGGVVAANFGVSWRERGLPEPESMLLCEPGSGPFSGARLRSYRDFSSRCKLVVVVGTRDRVVGQQFGRLVFETAAGTPVRNLIVQHPDPAFIPEIDSRHAEPYCLDMDFDCGVRNYTARSVLRRSRLNEVDYYCYWKLADALISGADKTAFGNTPEQRYMGRREDGKPLRELEVVLPGALSVQ